LANAVVQDVLLAMAGSGRSGPEYRRIELYSKRGLLRFADPAGESDVPVPLVAAVCAAAQAFEAYFDGVQAVEARSSWQRYLDLPRATQTGKMMAELYRLARLTRTLVFLPGASIECKDGLVRFGGILDKTVLTLGITPAGLRLIADAAAYALEALTGPYPEAYVAAVLGEYHAAIIDEIHKYSDEKRVPFQFRRAFPFNRHFRYDCDNAKTSVSDGALRIAIGEAQSNPALYPIDFFVIHDNALHIIPAEALTDGALPLGELPVWRARLPDGVTLSASFRHRFVREETVVNQPMT
jgi:hypothetical protein